MTESDLAKIEKTINGEDHPGDVWFIETIQALVDEIRSHRVIPGTNIPNGDTPAY